MTRHSEGRISQVEIRDKSHVAEREPDAILGSSSDSRRRWVLGAVVGTVAIGIGWLVGVVTTPTVIPQPGFAASGPLFESIQELAANSDLIVLGTVEEVQPGEVLEAEDPQYPTRRLNTVVQVDTVLKGEYSEETLTVATLELAYASPQPGSGSDWRQAGTRVVAFIAESSEGATGNNGEPLFFPVSYPQSFYIIEGKQLTAAYQESDQRLLSERIERMTLPELVAALAE